MASEYKIAFGRARTFEDAIQGLQMDVNDLIAVGWQPLGGFSLVANEEGAVQEKFIAAQAMTLTEKD